MSRVATALVLMGVFAGASASATEGVGNDQAVILFQFKAAPELAGYSASLGTVLRAELLRRPGLRLIGQVEAQEAVQPGLWEQIQACESGPCLAEAAEELGARFVIRGSLSHAGERLRVEVSLFDASMGRVAASDARTVASVDDLPDAVRTLANEMAVAGGFDPAISAEDFPRFGLQVGLGDALPTFSGLKIESINLRFALEGAYFFTSSLAVILSTNIDLAKESGGENFQFIPVSFGAKYFFRPGSWFRPYVSLGLGLGFLVGAISKADATPTSIELFGVTGLAFQPWRHLGFDVQASLDLSGVQLSASSGVLVGVNFDFGVFVLF